MKKYILLLLASVAVSTLTVVSCTKSSSSSSPAPAPPAMNATETALVGRWQLVDTHDTVTYYQNNSISSVVPMVRSNYTVSNYIDLSADMSVNFSLHFPQARHMVDNRQGVSAAGYWYYDTASRKLMLTGTPFDIVSQTANALTVRGVVDSRTSGSGPIQVYNSRFSR